MNTNQFAEKLNHWGKLRVPFLFMVDFEMEDCRAFPLQDLNPGEVLFDFQGFSNAEKRSIQKTVTLKKSPIGFKTYQEKFEKVMDGLSRGDSFLTNLTIKSEIQTDTSLGELYFLSQARYKILVSDQFLVFSPETFVRIEDGKIFSNPMKGTIDAAIPNAEETILKDQKELSEHVTIVDLIRNDLSQVARDVEVSRFRYIESLRTSDKNLLQVSSEIVGILDGEYWSRIGTIIMALLPAGSVSGAPKKRTLEIIRGAENEKRGFYTGVAGIFDGKKLDSMVMIRFIEKDGGKLYYRSGGGITTQSDPKREYNEAIDKIYVPVH